MALIDAPFYTHTPEPPPIGSNLIVLTEAVRMVREASRSSEWLVAALEHRAENGRAKYGDYLRIHNGRNPLVDYLQEQLDAVMYAAQVYVESPSAWTDELLQLAIEAAQKAHSLIEIEKTE